MFVALEVSIVLGLLVAYAYLKRGAKFTVPVSVNYHFSRKCNAACSFCFHTAKTSFVCSEEDARRGLKMLKDAGMRKINFAGGEPFLYPTFLGKMVRFCKEELRLESVSIVTNGSKVTEKFFQQYGKYIDILAVSCDSFDHETNVKIGRTDAGKDYDNVKTLSRISKLCKDCGVMFKMNSVICRLNWRETMAKQVAELEPSRWKVFQVLIVEGENDSEQTKRNATQLTITDTQFQDFCDRHKHLDCFVPENNEAMKDSYLILDEYMRFLDKDRNMQSKSILEVGVHRALADIVWDEQAFVDRGGLYDWTREGNDADKGCGSGHNEDLSW